MKRGRGRRLNITDREVRAIRLTVMEDEVNTIERRLREIGKTIEWSDVVRVFNDRRTLIREAREEMWQEQQS